VFSIILFTVLSNPSASAAGCEDRQLIADKLKEIAVKVGSLSVDQLNIAHKQTDIAKLMAAAQIESKSALMDQLDKNAADGAKNAAQVCHLMKEQDSDLRSLIDLIDSDPDHCGVADSKRDQLFASLKNNVKVKVSCGNNWQ
jgi:hypothetical protein